MKHSPLGRLLFLFLALSLFGCRSVEEAVETRHEAAMRVGGYSEFLAPEPEQRDVFAQATQGTQAEKLRPQSVATQVVAGTNYDFLCVAPDGHQTFHVLIFRPLPHTGEPPRLISVREVVR